MIAASQPIQRPADAKLLVIETGGALRRMPRSEWIMLLRPGDLVIANDAAVIPASLHGIHLRTGTPVEVRLAGRESLATEDVSRFWAIVFGAGDYHTRTEDRAPPPVLHTGDRLRLGPLEATIEPLPAHPRLVSLGFEGTPASIWQGLATHGRPIQYAHVSLPLAPWEVWTPIAGPPVAFEPPSAGFALDWNALSRIKQCGAAFATLTHAAGISSTGDSRLDCLLPFDEPYRIPVVTAQAIRKVRAHRGRVIAVGTTVVRALEHAALNNPEGRVESGEGIATGRIGASTCLRVVDATLTGTHEVDTSHYELLRAFADDSTLQEAARFLDAEGFRSHEFGDSVFVVAQRDLGRPISEGNCAGEWHPRSEQPSLQQG